MNTQPVPPTTSFRVIEPALRARPYRPVPPMTILWRREGQDVTFVDWRLPFEWSLFYAETDAKGGRIN